MLARQPVTRFTVAQFAALEAASEDRHELWDGQIFAMAGGSAAHSLVAQNAGTALQGALAARDCVVLQSDARIAVEAGGKYFYADIAVACAPIRFDAADRLAVANPCAVVEVLSPSTEALDRGPKLEAYRQNETIRDVLLIDIDARAVEHWFLADGGWERVVRRDGALRLAIGAELPIAALWSKLDLLAPAGSSGSG